MKILATSIVALFASAAMASGAGTATGTTPAPTDKAAAHTGTTAATGTETTGTTPDCSKMTDKKEKAKCEKTAAAAKTGTAHK